MRTSVQFPLTNSKLAAAFIKQNAAEAIPLKASYWGSRVFEDEISVRSRCRNAKLLTHIIDHFMWMHPRGKGTKGNPFLHEFYAACHTIKGIV